MFYVVCSLPYEGSHLDAYPTLALAFVGLFNTAADDFTGEIPPHIVKDI